MGLYLIEARIGSNVFIKVGITDRCPSKRLAGIATGCPVPPTLIAFDPRASQVHETQIHRRLSYWRSHLEWFHYTGEVVAFVNDMRAAFPIDQIPTLHWLREKPKEQRLAQAMRLARTMMEKGREPKPERAERKQRIQRGEMWMVGSNGKLAVSRASLSLRRHYLTPQALRSPNPPS